MTVGHPHDIVVCAIRLSSKSFRIENLSILKRNIEELIYYHKQIVHIQYTVSTRIRNFVMVMVLNEATIMPIDIMTLVLASGCQNTNC